ncbi:MAG: TonB-dependent receptor [Bacteroidales bacterium]|nr:TonB-dependent receptor [Bacteroidales bacterium]MDD3907598.1 TonB-dependent receptor [Bacteroidales bacterium]MDD4712553.1 TonB-dependent receptor [Bacteroidales bacterium]
MRKITLLFILSIFFSNLRAEMAVQKYLIMGQVVETKDGKEIPYATATIQDQKSKVVKRMSSDASGKFTIPVDSAGKYTLILTAFGYTESKLPFTVNEPKTNLGAIQMEQGVAIKEVSVVGQKPLVKIDPDKITYSIESDPDAQTSNGLEMLRKVPLLSVDGDDNVTLNGQSNYKVLVNGKSSSMMSNNFKEVIKSMPANTIKDIEVITNPSSKYEAEGVGGIINIITLKKTTNGYNGSVSSGFDSRGGLNGSLYFATKINKFGFSARYYGNQYKQPASGGFYTNENSNSTEYRTTRSDYSNTYNGYSSGYSGEASYDIDTFNLISMSFWGYSGNYQNEGLTTSIIKDNNGFLSRSFINYSSGESTYGSLSGNIDYQKTFKKPDKTFTISYKLDSDPSSSNSDNRIDDCFNYPEYHQRSNSKSITQEHTIQVDYYDPLTKMHQLELGVKAIFRDNSSNSDQFRNDTLRIDFSNDLDYNQYIIGAYAGYVFKLKKLTAKSGLRLETTWNDCVSTSDSVVRFSNRLFNIVPYINFAYQLKQGQTLKLSYTQRLYRPGIWYLNPYVDNSNPLNIRFGNPDLVSEIAHSFEAGYSLFSQKISLNTSLNASINNNSIESVSTMNDRGVTSSTYKNIGMDQRYNWNNYFSYRLGVKFSVSANATASYTRLAANNGFNMSNDGFGFRGSLNLRKSLWKDAAISGNAGFSSPYISLQGKSSGYSYTSLGFSQKLLKQKLSLNLSISEPFREKRTYSYNTKGEGYVAHGEGSYSVRYLQFSASYNFGKLSSAVKKAKRGISNEDVKSGGGNPGSGGEQ